MFTKRPGFFAGLAFALAAIALLGAATAVVRVGQANTYSGGFLNDFASAKLKPPTATVATLPAAAAGNASQVYEVTDGGTPIDCTVGTGSTRVFCYSNGSAWVAFAANAATTGNAATATALAANGTNCNAASYPLGVDASGNSESCTTVAASFTTLHANDAFAYCSGTVYTLTNSAAAVDCGTTDPSVTIAAAGTYLVLGSMCYENAGATYAANRTVTGTINRTNNSPGIIASSGLSYQTGIITTVTNTMGCSATQVLYTTANTDDILTLNASIDVVASAGTSTVARARLAAIRLY